MPKKITFKNLGKELKKRIDKVNDVLENKALKQIGEFLVEDIKRESSKKRHAPNYLGSKEKTPELTHKTKRTYKTKGYNTAADFKKTGSLLSSIKAKIKNRTLTVGPTNSKNKAKIIHLADTKAPYGGTKKSRVPINLSGNRLNRIKRIISDLLKKL